MKVPVFSLIIFSLACIPLVSQDQILNHIPRDTTYTTNSAYSKIRKKYPYIIPAQVHPNSGIRADLDIVYRKIENRALLIDIYQPEINSQEKFPVILCIHGGGWASGNKSMLAPLAQELALQGYLTATVEYRLSPEAKYPSGIMDVKSAIQWLKRNAGMYDLDTNRMVILGSSAGATIATLAGNTPDHPLYKQDEYNTPNASDRVQAIVNIDGILDFTDPAESGKDQDPLKPSAAARWFGTIYKEDPDLWKEASPLTYAGQQSPPTLFINSSIPRFHAGRDAYISILNDSGIRNSVYTIPDSPHSFWLFHPWFDDTVEQILQFLKTAL